MDPDRPLATTEEVAAYLQVPEKTVRNWRRSGTGPPYVRLGKHVRYDWADVERWLDAQRAG